MLFGAIHHTLDVGKQDRQALHLVENHPLVGLLSQEGARIIFGGDSDIRVFQGKMALCGKGHPSKCRFSRLTRPKDGYYRIFRGRSEEFCSYISSDHGSERVSEACANVELNFIITQLPLRQHRPKHRYGRNLSDIIDGMHETFLPATATR